MYGHPWPGATPMPSGHLFGPKKKRRASSKKGKSKKKAKKSGPKMGLAVCVRGKGNKPRKCRFINRKKK